jgi:hypothetical protein
MSKIQTLGWFLALMVGASLQAFAGANTAQLNCSGTSAGHQISLAGAIPATIEEADLKLLHKDQAIHIVTPEQLVTANTDFQHRAFALAATLPGQGQLQLKALPGSIKYKGSFNAGKLSATFKAVLQSVPEPLHSSLLGTHLSCNYAYEV